MTMSVHRPFDLIGNIKGLSLVSRRPYLLPIPFRRQPHTRTTGVVSNNLETDSGHDGRGGGE